MNNQVCNQRKARRALYTMLDTIDSITVEAITAAWECNAETLFFSARVAYQGRWIGYACRDDGDPELMWVSDDPSVNLRRALSEADAYVHSYGPRPDTGRCINVDESVELLLQLKVVEENLVHALSHLWIVVDSRQVVGRLHAHELDATHVLAARDELQRRYPEGVILNDLPSDKAAQLLVVHAMGDELLDSRLADCLSGRIH